MHANIAILFPHNNYTQYFFYYFTQNNDICFINYSLGQKYIDEQLKSFDTHVIFSSHQLEKQLGIRFEKKKYHILRLDSIYGKFYYLWYSFLGYLFLSIKKYKNNFLNKSVYLFTSGSTGYPKLIEMKLSALKKNIEGWIEYAEPQPYHRMLCSLPYFHSYGLNTGLIFPLLQRLGYTSTNIEFYFDYRIQDPITLSSTIREYGIQHITITPYFLNLLLDNAHPEHLQTLESVVVGGDFSSDALIKKFYKILPYTKYQKGYGLTECFPIVSLLPTNDNNHNTQSDGKILSHIHYRIMDQEGQISEYGKGILLINIESTVGSYYDEPLETVEINGKVYFNTQDYVYANTDGHITILGRMKRIIKKGSEMINLEYMQLQLNQEFEGVCIGKDEHIYFFTTQNLDTIAVNTYIFNNGLSQLHNISKVITINNIPMISIGKINYKALEDMLEEKKQVAEV